MESHSSVARLETLWCGLPTGLSSALVSRRTSVLAVAGVSLPLSERLILQVAPKTAARLSASVIQVSLGVCGGGP